MLKYILENKHEDTNFKCAVIVNDMAELNIDKSLIDSTDLIQTDEAMVGMQNGCICCTLQTDLVEQIIGLVQKRKFTHILIEASGVSEPHEIAPLFEVEEHEHEHNSEEAEAQCESSGKPQLGEVARIDTCVTMIDSADFYSNLSSMRTYDNCELVDLEGMDCQPIVGTIAELMMDQVEFANVIILNKKDLVNEGQQNDLEEKIKCLNPKANIVRSIQAKIDLNEIINTGLYVSKDEFWVTSYSRRRRMTRLEKRVRGFLRPAPLDLTSSPLCIGRGSLFIRDVFTILSWSRSSWEVQRRSRRKWTRKRTRVMQRRRRTGTSLRTNAP